MRQLDPVSLGIMWDRMISITDEVMSALVRTSFSSNVRDSYDLSVLLFSANGMNASGFARTALAPTIATAGDEATLLMRLTMPSTFSGASGRFLVFAT